MLFTPSFWGSQLVRQHQRIRGPGHQIDAAAGVTALPIESCRIVTDTEVPAHLLGSLTRRRDFRDAGADLFGPQAQNPRQARFESAGEDALLI
jgi:hypothetical protein